MGDSFIATVVTNSSGTVTGLEPATLYRIAIGSINSGGKRQPSPFRKAKRVRWKAVHSAAVSLVRSDGLDSTLKENTTSTSLVLTHLDPGTLYTTKSHAWNVSGVPGDDFMYNQRRNKKFPFLKPRGALTYSVTASNGLLKLKCNASSASCTVPSLQASSEYYVSATAYSDAGSSKPADAVSLKTVGFRFAPELLRFKKCSPTSNYCWEGGEGRKKKKRDKQPLHCKTSRVAFKRCFTLLNTWWTSPIRKVPCTSSQSRKGSDIYQSQQKPSHSFRFPLRDPGCLLTGFESLCHTQL